MMIHAQHQQHQQQQQQHHQQQQQQHLQQQQQQQLQQQKSQNPYSHVSSVHAQQKAGAALMSGHHHHHHSGQQQQQHLTHPQLPHTLPHQASSRVSMPPSPSSSSSLSRSVAAAPGGYEPASPQMHPSVVPHPAVHPSHPGGLPAHPPGLAAHPSAHPMLSPGAKGPPRYPHQQQQTTHHPHPHHRPSSPSPSADYQRWASPSSAATAPRHVTSDVAKHVTGDPGARAMMRAQPPVGSIRTGEPRLQHLGEAGSHGNSGGRHGNPAALMAGGAAAGLVPPAAVGKGSIQLGTPAVKPSLVAVEEKMETGAKTPSGGTSSSSGVPLDLSRSEPGRPGDAPLDLTVKTRKRSAGDVSPAVALSERQDLLPPALKKPRHELASPGQGGGEVAYHGHYLPRPHPHPHPADRAALEWQAQAAQHLQAKSGGVGVAAKKDSPGAVPVMPGLALNPGYPHPHPHPHHHGNRVPAAAAAFGPDPAAGIVVGQSPVSKVSPKAPHVLDLERTHSRGSSSGGGGGGAVSQPRSQSFEMSFEGKVEDGGPALLPPAKLIKGAPTTAGAAPLSALERVQHMQMRAVEAMQGQAPMKPRPPPAPQQPHPHRESGVVAAGGYVADVAAPRVPMTEEQMFKAMQQQQQQFQRHQQQHSYPPKSATSAVTAAAARPAPHSQGSAGRVGQEHAMAAQSPHQYAQYQQEMRQHQQQHALQRQQQKQQQQQQQRHQLQVLQEQQKHHQHLQQQQHHHAHQQQLHHQQQQPQQRQLQQQQLSQLQYESHAHQLSQFAADLKAEGPHAATERRYTAHELLQQQQQQQLRQEEVRKAKMQAAGRGGASPQADDRLAMSWPHQQHPMARASLARASSHESLEAVYAGKVREQQQQHAQMTSHADGSGVGQSGAPEMGREHGKTPQTGGRSGGGGAARRDDKTGPFGYGGPLPVPAPAASTRSPALYPGGPSVPTDRTTPSAALRSPEASLSGPRRREGSPHSSAMASPAVAESSRPRPDSAGREGFGSRPPSAARSAGSGREGRTPGLEDVSTGEVPAPGEASFQRPQPVSGSRAAPRGKEADAAGEAGVNDVEIISKEEAAPGAAIPNSGKSSSSSEEFLTPLSIAIPSSPTVGPASAPRPASPAPPPAPPPPPPSSSKVLSRKRMILNAVNQDESLKKFIGGSGGSLRQFSASPPPSSPKMPILSPQEKGDSEEASGQNDDPPQLDPSAPLRRCSSARQLSNLVRGGLPAAANSASLAPTPPGTATTTQDKAPAQSLDSASLKAAGSEATKAVSSSSSSSSSATAPSPVPTVSATAGPEPELAQDKSSESGLARRCSVSAADLDRSSDPAGQGQAPGGQGPLLPRPDGIRRNSLDRPWGHQKNIPVANVAPFVHSKSGGDLAAGREGPDTSLTPTLPEAQSPDSGQPKSEDVKLDGTGTKLLVVGPAEAGSKSATGRQAPRSGGKTPRSEKRKRLSQSQGRDPRALSKSPHLLDKLDRLKRSRSKSRRPKTEALDSPELAVDAFRVGKGSDCELMDRDLQEVASTLRRKKPRSSAGSRSAKHRRSKQRSQQSSAERPKAAAATQGSDADTVVEADTDTGQAADKTADAKSKKEDLALSREERAKRRALLRGKEEEKEKKSNRNRMNKKRPRNRTQRRRLSSTNQKARELKRSALGRRPRREAAKRKGGHYNRNAAYEEEIRRDESRKAIRRARRHASNLARERLQQQHRQGSHDDNVDDDEDEEEEEEAENSQDDTEQLPVGDEPWDISGAHAHSSRNSRKLRAARGTPGKETAGFSGGLGGCKSRSAQHIVETSDPEDYFDDADDESKDISEDDDGEETEVGEGNSAASSSRGKGRSVLRRKRHGKVRPIRRRHLEATFAEDSLDALGHEVLYPEGDEVCDVSGQSTIPVPPEVKRIAVNKNSGETLLHRAARLGNEEVTLYCLRSGEYQVNARDNAGYTALHESCVKGSVRVARHLIVRGADVNCCSQDGIRPLHDAVENDHAEVVRLLLSSGADPLIATYGGKTPLKIARTPNMYDLIKGYLGDLNGYESEEERQWHLPGSCTLHGATGNPDNGFDIFADVPTDDDDVSVDEMFDDSITAAVPTYELPSESPDSNGQAVVLLDDLLKHLRIPHKHVSSLPLCVRAQLYVSGLQLQRMLERSLLRRASHSALLESDKVAVIPVSALRKVESSLEQLCRRPSSKALSSSSSSASAALLLDLQLDSESSLIRHLGEMSLTHRGDDVSRGDDGGGSDVKGKCGLTSAKPALTMTASRSGAWRVLGGDAPASALPLPLPVSGPGGDKAAVSSVWVKSEKSLIAPSVLSKALSLPATTHGFPHGSASHFSRNWSGKFSLPHSFSDQPSSGSCADRAAATLARTPIGKLPTSTYGKMYFSGLFSEMPSRDVLGKLAESQRSGPLSEGQRLSETNSFSSFSTSSSSSSSLLPTTTAAAAATTSPFSAWASFSSTRFSPMSFKTAAFQTKATKAGSRGDSETSVLTFSAAGHAPQGRGQGSPRQTPAPKSGPLAAAGTSVASSPRPSAGAAFNGGVSGSSGPPEQSHCARLSPATSLSGARPSGFSRGVHSASGNSEEHQSSRGSHSAGSAGFGRGAHSGPVNPDEAQSSRGSQSPSSSGFSRGTHGSSLNADEPQSSRGSQQSPGGAAARQAKRSSVSSGFGPAALPYSQTIPPGLNPSVVIKTVRNALSPGHAVVVKSSSSTSYTSGQLATSASLHGNHGNAGRPKATSGGELHHRYGSADPAWKPDLGYGSGSHKPRWPSTGTVKTSSTSSMTSPHLSSTSLSGKGEPGPKWSGHSSSSLASSYPSAPQASLSSSSPSSSFVKDCGKERSKSPAWAGTKHSASNPHDYGSAYSATPTSAPAPTPAPFSSLPFSAGSGSSSSSPFSSTQAQTVIKTASVKDGRTPQWFSQRTGLSAKPGASSSSSSSSSKSSPASSSSSPSSSLAGAGAPAGKAAPPLPSFPSSKRSSLASVSAASPYKGGEELSREAGGGVRATASTTPPSQSADGSAAGKGGGAKGKTSQCDFDQMFSDESSSNSFTTVVDNLDYDSSRSPAAPCSSLSGAAATTTTTATATASPHCLGHGADAPFSGSGGKGFGMGVFGSVVSGKDRNDNDIGIFTPKS